MEVIVTITAVALLILLGACVYAVIDFINQINNIK
jgi:hypothetical protein